MVAHKTDMSGWGRIYVVNHIIYDVFDHWVTIDKFAITHLLDIQNKPIIDERSGFQFTIM